MNERAQTQEQRWPRAENKQIVQRGQDNNAKGVIVRTMIIAMVAGAGLVSTAMIAGAKAAVPPQTALVAMQNPAFSPSPMDTLATSSAASVLPQMIQGTAADLSDVSLLFAWAAVAMLLALCWDEWKRT